MSPMGKVSEAKIIARIAEDYDAQITPLNPMEPISLATTLQLAASYPNFLMQDQISLVAYHLKTSFKLEDYGHVMIPKSMAKE
ncbi:MAG: galactonate dehydratase [Arcticibacterium sp.]|jgi:galactonate dehydratase